MGQDFISLCGNVRLTTVLPQVMLFSISMRGQNTSHSKIVVFFFWRIALQKQEDRDLWSHRLRIEPQVPCITGSQENDDLPRNEERKFLPVDPPQAMWGNRNRVTNEWSEHEFVPNLGISLDSHAPGSTGKKEKQTLYVYMLKDTVLMTHCLKKNSAWKS